MENNIQDILNSNSIKKSEENNYFSGYLIPGNLFSLKKPNGEVDILSKFVIVMKPVSSISSDVNYEDIFNDIAKFTNSNAINNVSNSIYVVEDNFKEFVSWLKNKYPNFVVSVTINELQEQVKDIVVTNINNKDISNDIVQNSNQQINQPVIENKDTNILQQENNQVLNSQDIDNKPSYSFDGTVKEVPEVDNHLNQPNVLKRSRMAGFIKFPVFLLTIIAIGAFGIFIGKMFYAYLSQM
jgi:hypothetical protein